MDNIEEKILSILSEYPRGADSEIIVGRLDGYDLREVYSALWRMTFDGRLDYHQGRNVFVVRNAFKVITKKGD